MRWGTKNSPIMIFSRGGGNSRRIIVKFIVPGRSGFRFGTISSFVKTTGEEEMVEGEVLNDKRKGENSQLHVLLLCL